MSEDDTTIKLFLRTREKKMGFVLLFLFYPFWKRKDFLKKKIDAKNTCKLNDAIKTSIEK